MIVESLGLGGLGLVARLGTGEEDMGVSDSKAFYSLFLTTVLYVTGAPKVQAKRGLSLERSLSRLSCLYP